MNPSITLTKGWQKEMKAAVSAAREAGSVIRADFGDRKVVQRKGHYDVQLRADLTSQRVIVRQLTDLFPDYGIVSEEGMQGGWDETDLTWVVDPLDGTNNFGYGIAHCAVAITLFAGDAAVLAVVLDPLLGRTFTATAGDTPRSGDLAAATALRDATVALVTDYSVEGRVTGRHIEDMLSGNCKRVTTMWAPALDLALVGSGAIDAMVARNAALMDVCAGILLVQAAGGTVLGLDGRPLELRKSLHSSPVSFVAARSRKLAADLSELALAVPGW
ncbi:inositol monophosphatase family protein [Actinacidiphila sp. ITFR-21]|uniref:inositol monophosphatase family protein n=1 Tax=Actinacidiphila sp. ITFR-21 TaxID=3075199 RepID=UPI00288A70CE|nr:inositol monophosphatase [Streptomyces sp. ITFR-21]WNI15294.1 inositol monophosphatase [Streptomyces sp. ITFR-21]